MQTVRIGIVGVGNMGSAHAHCIRSGRVGGLSLTALCDNDPKRLQYCREAFPEVACYLDLRDMLASGRVDAVIVAVPHRLHAAIASQALENGLHVLVEKPIDVSVSVAARLNAVAKASGRVFGIMFNQRTNPLFARARDIVQSGGIGQLKRTSWTVTNWYRTQAYYDSGSWRATWAGEGGGVLLNQAPHNLDIWQWICGMPVAVMGFCSVGKYHNIEVEDEAVLHVRYENGAIGTFITSTGEYPGVNRLEIVGDGGLLVLEKGRLCYTRLCTSEREVCFDSPEGMPSIPCEETVYTPDGAETAHAGILQNFANAIRFGEPLLAPGYEGVAELSLSNAAYLSAWEDNRWVELPFDDAHFDELLRQRRAASRYRTAENPESLSEGYNARWQVNW